MPDPRNRDLLQIAALATYFGNTGQAAQFNAAWRDLVSRGRGWRSRAKQGHDTLFRLAPDVEREGLWKE